MKAKLLSASEIRLLKKNLEIIFFPNSSNLVYENQVPIFGIVILEGQAFLTRKKKIVDTLGPGTIFGVHELINNEPVKYGIKIQENSRVILLQKSEVSRLIRGRNNALKELLLENILLEQSSTKVS